MPIKFCIGNFSAEKNWKEMPKPNLWSEFSETEEIKLDSNDLKRKKRVNERKTQNRNGF